RGPGTLHDPARGPPRPQWPPRGEVRIEERGPADPRQRLPEILALVLLGAAGVIADDRVDAAVRDGLPQGLAIGFGPDRRVDLAADAPRPRVRSAPPPPSPPPPPIPP